MCVDKVPRRVSGLLLKTAQAQVPDPQGGAAGVLARGKCASPNTYPLVHSSANIPPPKPGIAGDMRFQVG
jgi:hypothetical protein